jgi:DNA-binding NarL/FixJ family response regulator
VGNHAGNGKAGRVTATEPYRVFLCDDVADIRMLMRFALEEDPELRVVGEAEDGLSGVDGIVETRPDVVLLDLSMPGLDGLEVITRVREAAPETGILVFSGFAAERMSVVALALGADGYLEKGEPLETVRQAVRDLASRRRNHDE